MSVKKSLDIYLKKLLLYWNKNYKSLPLIAWDPDINQSLYIGDPDEEEYIHWKPKLKEEYDDFKKIESLLGIKIHHSLKEYFSSYYFLEFEGFYNSKRITLEPVEPSKDIFTYFNNLKKYEEIKGFSEFRYIHIGIISPEDMSIEFDNRSGKIVKRNYEINTIEEIATSLEILIDGIVFEK